MYNTLYVRMSFFPQLPPNQHLRRNDFIITMGPFLILSFYDFFFVFFFLFGRGGGAGERICVLGCVSGWCAKERVPFFFGGGGKAGVLGFWWRDIRFLLCTYSS